MNLLKIFGKKSRVNMVTLGLKSYGHDTSAAIVVDGKIIAATSEERFNREKHSRKFPVVYARPSAICRVYTT